MFYVLIVPVFRYQTRAKALEERGCSHVAGHILAQNWFPLEFSGALLWTGFLGCNFVGDACLKFLEQGVSVAGE